MKIRDLLNWLDSNKKNYKFVGNEEEEIMGFSSLKQYKPNTLTWIKKQENIETMNKVPEIQLAIIQVGVEVQAKNTIESNDSKEIFFEILEEFFGNKDHMESIGTGTYISPQVVLGKHVIIGHNCTLDGEISIGDDTVIANQVSIVNQVSIGRKCSIQSLTVIGEDGFGYFENEVNEKTMISHYGGVVIGDNVFIGSHVNIARGTIDNTVIEDGVKIAPSTHIGHNNLLKKNSTIICSKLFGSVEIKENAYVVSSTVKNQCKVGKNSFVGMGSLVTRNVEDGKTVVGIPAKELSKYIK